MTIFLSTCGFYILDIIALLWSSFVKTVLNINFANSGYYLKSFTISILTKTFSGVAGNFGGKMTHPRRRSGRSSHIRNKQKWMKFFMWEFWNVIFAKYELLWAFQALWSAVPVLARWKVYGESLESAINPWTKLESREFHKMLVQLDWIVDYSNFGWNMLHLCIAHLNAFEFDISSPTHASAVKIMGDRFIHHIFTIF